VAPDMEASEVSGIQSGVILKTAFDSRRRRNEPSEISATSAMFFS